VFGAGSLWSCRDRDPFPVVSGEALFRFHSRRGRPHPRGVSRVLFVVYPLPFAPMRKTVHIDLLVPLSDNAKRPFPDSAFAAFEDFLLDVAGGFTRRGDVEGAWRSPSGETLRDASRLYSLTLGADDAAETVGQIASHIRRAFRQMAAFVEAVPTEASGF